MKPNLLFVSNRFLLNDPYERYLLRHIKEKFASIGSITYFEESDKTLLTHLERHLMTTSQMVIITTKSTFTLVGKLLSTLTDDNQIIKESILTPSRATIIDTGSYVLEHKGSEIHVLLAMEGEQLPRIAPQKEETVGWIHLFDEEFSLALGILEPLANSFDVKLDASEMVMGWIKIKVTPRKYGNITQFITIAKTSFPHKIMVTDSVPRTILETLTHHHQYLSFAESCSGGLLATYFTAQAGASQVYKGSLITYDNGIKAQWLAVEEETLESYGAVSAEVVDQMSQGALSVSGADFALAISGVAGPGGGSEFKPVGTVYISVKTHTSVQTQRFHFKGDRNYIQEQSVLMAVKMLLNSDPKLFFS